MTEIRQDQIVVQDIADDPLVAASRDVALSDMQNTGYVLSTAKYDNKTFDFGSEMITVTSVYVSPDGVNMYTADSDGGAASPVQHYALSTPWDVSTAVTAGSLNPPLEVGKEQGIWLKPDGTMLFIMFETGILNSYTLTTPWNLASATTLVATVSLTFGGSVQGLRIMDDGLTAFVVVGNSIDSVEQINFGVAWDVSTATVANISKDVSAQHPSPAGVDFSNSGDKMYIVGNSISNLTEYDLSVPWDITTAVYNSVSYSYNDQLPPTGAFDLFIRNDGTSVILVGALVKAYQYDIGGQAFMKRASDTVEGILSIATQAEVDAGTDTLKAVVAGTLSNVVGNYLPLDGSNVMTGNLNITAANPRLKLNSDYLGDGQSWDFVAFDVDGRLLVRALDGSGITASQFTFLPSGNITAPALVPTAIDHLTRRDYVDTTTVALNGSRAMTGDLTISKNDPRVIWNSTLAPLDEKDWRWKASANGGMTLQTYFDNGSFGRNVLDLERTGINVDYFTVTATAINLNGLTTSNQRIDIQHNNPILSLTELDQPADNQRWDIISSASDLIIAPKTDAGGAGANLFKWTRTAQQVDTFEGVNAGSTWFTVDNNSKTVDIAGDLTVGDGTSGQIIKVRGKLGGFPQYVIYDNLNIRQAIMFTANDSGGLTLRSYQADGNTIGAQITLSAGGNVTLTGLTATADNHMVDKGFVDSTLLTNTNKTSFSTISDLDSLVVSGFYYAASTATGNPTVNNSWVEHHEETSTSRAIQTATNSLARAVTYRRVRSASVWSAWLRIVDDLSAAEDYVSLAGDTMTGDLVITGAIPSLDLFSDDAAVDQGRWRMYAAPTNFVLRTLDDAGGFLENVLVINRTAAVNSVGWDTPIMTNTGVYRCNLPPTAVDDLTRKDYVDGKFDLGIRAVTSSTTSVVGDRNNAVEINSASATNFTIAPNSSVNVPIGTQCVIVQEGTGQTTIVAGSGVTLKAPGGKLRTAERYDAITIYQSALNVWRVFGGIL